MRTTNAIQASPHREPSANSTASSALRNKGIRAACIILSCGLGTLSAMKMADHYHNPAVATVGLHGSPAQKPHAELAAMNQAKMAKRLLASVRDALHAPTEYRLARNMSDKQFDAMMLGRIDKALGLLQGVEDYKQSHPQENISPAIEKLTQESNDIYKTIQITLCPDPEVADHGMCR